VRVAGRPAATVAGRLAAIVDDRTACALISSVASRIHHALRERGVVTDFRGDVLRLGPAPYLPDDQLRDAVSRLGEALRSPSR
jgi:kynureninase